MKIFIAGVMQGTMHQLGIRPQDYRAVITKILVNAGNDIEVIDPDVTDPDRLSYTHKQAAEMFFKYCHLATEVDILIAYLPEVSMGTAIEMWNAYQTNTPVLTISALNHNWVVKLLSRVIYSSLEEFERAVKDGILHQV